VFAVHSTGSNQLHQIPQFVVTVAVKALADLQYANYQIIFEARLSGSF